MKDFVDEYGGGEWGRVGLSEEIMSDVLVVCHRDTGTLSVYVWYKKSDCYCSEIKEKRTSKCQAKARTLTGVRETTLRSLPKVL